MCSWTRLRAHLRKDGRSPRLVFLLDACASVKNITFIDTVVLLLCDPQSSTCPLQDCQSRALGLTFQYKVSP